MSSTLDTTLTGLVGLADKNDPCFTTDRPATYNNSSSGYFLTDYEIGVPLQAALFSNIAPGQSSIWDMLAEARTRAIRDFKHDLGVMLSDERKKRVYPFTGRIGETRTENKNTYATVSRKVLGVQVEPFSKYRKLRYTSFMLKSLYLYLDTTKTVTLNITSNDPSFTSQTVSIDAVAGTAVKVSLETEIELPFYASDVNELKYNVWYTRGDERPLNSKIYSDYGESSPPANLHVRGFALDIIDNNYDAGGGDAYGIAFEGYLKTYPLDWICDLQEKGASEYLNIIARILTMKGGIHLASMIIDSGRPNYYTAIKAEYLFGKRKKLATMYNNHIMKLVKELPSQVLEIYGASKGAMHVASIKN